MRTIRLLILLITAHTLPMPPLIPATLDHIAGPDPLLLVEVKHGADSAEELGVHPLTLGLPVEELVVHLVVLVQHLQVLCQVGRVLELVHMQERIGRSHSFVILNTCSHHDWEYVVPQAVVEELLGDVLLAVGVFKGQVELVLLLQHVKALSVFPQASQVATCSVDIHLKGSPVFDV